MLRFRFGTLFSSLRAQLVLAMVLMSPVTVMGLRLWLVGILIWAIGHLAAVWAAKRDPHFAEVVRRHLRIPGHLEVGEQR